MGKRTRQKTQIYEVPPLPIVINIDGRETVFATGRHGEDRFALLDHLKAHFGAGNVRMMTDFERNRIASSHRGWDKKAA